MNNPLDSLIARPQPSGAKYQWATVVQVNPIKILIDGDYYPLEGSPNSIGQVSRDDRVLVLIEGRRATVLGAKKEAVSTNPEFTVVSSGQPVVVTALNWQAYPFDQVLVNVGGGAWNGTTYTVPKDGVYTMNAAVRGADYMENRNIGMTINTAGVDDQFAVWGQSGVTRRSGLTVTRTARWKIGDKIRLWFYSEGDWETHPGRGQYLSIHWVAN